MEPNKNDAVKLPDMIMCGDHPSFTKTELNAKESKIEANRDKEKNTMSRTRISPTSSRTEAGEPRTRAASEHALRLLAARRRVRSLEVVQRPDVSIATGNRTLVQAALGTFRWPPYLLAVWVLVLVLTHVLHCLVGLLERALPSLRKFCQYFRAWAEDSWRTETDLNHRLYPMGLACLTGLLYTLYFGLYALYCIAVWAIEPLCSEMENKHSSSIIEEPKITNYVEEVNSKVNSSIKQ
ncbi:uncharacterized protein LOC115446225 [Manduca sexta]|uniref:Uncharacterized protein n=1 Tax=Manduca sexta TaxID=7130 RepID=A0A922CQB4_MANSE|nr:uncharacterized protein LOC115446225 [Manduca sexta]KAG6454354.1 hypothetical protein O3G_MSEX008659 [Manduca sexta]